MTESNELNERYKIQLFSGSTLDEANKTRRKFKEKHPNQPASIEYQTPNYKVWVGDFRDRLEAERLFITIKEDFKSSFVFKPR
ncbi:SPOR domain-containing protein [Mesonia sp. MT50]|uniref:SPOR domain-containing protein n=1 Tax=Mesonia profundi TaxID=3070998 RepID=A0ABU0ZZV8_9FLAO|nr:SPOR domain-containing protein [Mesonia profundi]MDQ7916982.1 SPOR domain-containing protein [Mesonia profundi]